MRKTDYLLLIFFFIFQLYAAPMLCAQGTLEFNQVKLVTSSEETVPGNKVWKIESVLGNSTTTSGFATNVTPTIPPDHLIHVAENAIAVAAQLELGGGGAYYSESSNRNSWFTKELCTTLPIWLPEGTTLRAGSNVTLISVIEFNIIP